MKVFIVDNTRKLMKIRKELEKDFTVESKKDCSFKMTKNDFAIISDEIGLLDGAEKLKNVFFITTDKRPEAIWNYASNYNTVDIIDNKLDEAYMAQRIKKKMGA